jgi:pyridoxine 5-phosphate synthase
MTRLSVNVNKVATLRNARGGNIPDLLKVSADIESFGAQGITVHPRPDERHIRYQDVRDLSKLVRTEFNIEGYPSEDFLQLCEEVQPDQVTLVPDGPDVITSNAGWDTLENKSFLQDVVGRLRSHGMRVSIFLDADPELVGSAQETGTDRCELYTEDYARMFAVDREKAIAPYLETAEALKKSGLGVNAGHDLNLDNLNYFVRNIPWIDEVSIGHALISDALYYGLENVVQMYLYQIER